MKHENRIKHLKETYYLRKNPLFDFLKGKLNLPTSISHDKHGHLYIAVGNQIVKVKPETKEMELFYSIEFKGDTRVRIGCLPQCIAVLIPDRNILRLLDYNGNPLAEKIFSSMPSDFVIHHESGIVVSFKSPLRIEKINKSFCGGSRGKKGRFEVKKGRRVEQKPSVGLKASKPFLHENSNTLHDHQHFDAFSAESVHSKKPSGGPKGLIGPPCHGALAAGGNFTEQKPVLIDYHFENACLDLALCFDNKKDFFYMFYSDANLDSTLLQVNNQGQLLGKQSFAKKTGDVVCDNKDNVFVCAGGKIFKYNSRLELEWVDSKYLKGEEKKPVIYFYREKLLVAHRKAFSDLMCFDLNNR